MSGYLDKERGEAASILTARLMETVTGVDHEVAQVALANVLSGVIVLQNWDVLDSLELQLPEVAENFADHIRDKIKNARGIQT